MKISRHPAPESLMSCGAGSMPEAFAAVMASHIELCPECRKTLALMTTIGKALLDLLPPTAVLRRPSALALRAMEADVDEERASVRPSRGDVPFALAARLGNSLDSIRWSPAGPGLSEHNISLSSNGRGCLRLVQAEPGAALPQSGHAGSEISLVLRGSYRDATGEFSPGDIADVSNGYDEAWVAGSEGCICLVASDGQHNGHAADRL